MQYRSSGDGLRCEYRYGRRLAYGEGNALLLQSQVDHVEEMFVCPGIEVSEAVEHFHHFIDSFLPFRQQPFLEFHEDEFDLLISTFKRRDLFPNEKHLISQVRFVLFILSGVGI